MLWPTLRVAGITRSRRLAVNRLVIRPRWQRRVECFAVPDTRGASYPRVAAEQTSSVAYVVWTSAAGEHSALRFLRWNIGRGEGYSRTR